MTVKEDSFSNFLQKWVQLQFHIDIQVAKADFFSFSFMNNTLYWSLYADKTAKQFYLDFLHEQFPGIDLKKYSFFTISFLHEIGHIISDRDLGSDFLVTQFKEELKELKDNSKESHYSYFLQPGEMLATTWLVNYCYVTADKVQMLDQKIRFYLQDFYNDIADMQ